MEGGRPTNLASRVNGNHFVRLSCRTQHHRCVSFEQIQKQRLVVSKEFEFSLFETGDSGIVVHQFSKTSNGRCRTLRGRTLSVLHGLKFGFQSTEFSSASFDATMNITKGENHGVHALADTLSPTFGVLVVVPCKTTLHVNAFAANVRDKFTAGFGIQMKQGGVPIVKMEAAVPGKGDLKMILIESKLGLEEIVPQSPCLILNHGQHTGKIPVGDTGQVVAIKVKDQIRTLPQLIGHFQFVRAAPVSR